MAIDLDKLERLARAATPGLVCLLVESKDCGEPNPATGIPEAFYLTASGLPKLARFRRREDAEYAAVAWFKLPALIAEVRHLRSEVRRKGKLADQGVDWIAAERDRYREALRQISVVGDCECEIIARTALAGKGEA